VPQSDFKLRTDFDQLLLHISEKRQISCHKIAT